MAASNSLDATQVRINGSNRDAKEDKQQRLQQSPEKPWDSCSAEVRAKVEHHKFLIGRNGANIKKVRESTGARIIFPTGGDEDKELIKIFGNQDAVDAAKAELESAIEKILYSQIIYISVEIYIEPKYQGYFLARRGEVLHQIIEDSGEVQISFPQTGIDGKCVIIKGTPESVKAAKQRMLDMVQDLKSMVTIECEIPRRHRHVVIGPKGCKVQAISAEFNVLIKFPERFPQEEWRSDKRCKDEELEAVDIVSAIDVARITGQLDNAEAARQTLLSLVPITIKVDVPNSLRGLIIGKGGRDVKELMQKYDVQIVFPGTKENLDYITITGIQDRVNETKEAILEKLKHVEKYSQVKIELDSEYHPKIIEDSGAEIAKIITDNDVGIYFPRIGDPKDNIITILGCRKNAENARDDLMKIINEMDQRSSDLLIHTDITEEEKRTLDMSDIREEYTDVDDQIEITDKRTEPISSKLDNDVILKQEKTINELREYIDDQVLTNKALKVKHANLILEIDSERQECERIIRDKEKCDEETAKMLKTIKDLEENLKIEREEKFMLQAESNKISKRLEELHLEYQMLQGSKESLSNAVKESKSTHNVVIPSEDFELANYRKTSNKLDEVISNNNELSNTLAERIKDIERFKTIIESKEDEISKLKINLSDALEKNIELSKIIQSLNGDKLDEHGVTERAKHAAKLQEITSNVYDLKEKLIQMTKISQYGHSSSEICKNFNKTV